MNLNEYQKEAASTAIFPEDVKYTYTALGLVNEAGEYAGKIKKILRKDGELNKAALVAELGDVLWYVSACASALDVCLDDVAQYNLDKLKDRANRGVLKGNGDTR